jgi:catechol 2,3-dioxygenase-like lactoylglutathione lyase family enzyme
MVRTLGLTHLALAVRDVDKSSRFYQHLLGAVEVCRHEGFAQLQTPGAWDMLVLEERPADAGKPGGILHFGYRLLSALDIDEAADAVIAAGGTIRRRGEFGPGAPYLFASDLDGYEIEIVFEPPTSADPPLLPERF